MRRQIRLPGRRPYTPRPVLEAEVLTYVCGFEVKPIAQTGREKWLIKKCGEVYESDYETQYINMLWDCDEGIMATVADAEFELKIHHGCSNYHHVYCCPKCLAKYRPKVEVEAADRIEQRKQEDLDLLQHKEMEREKLAELMKNHCSGCLDFSLKHSKLTRRMDQVEQQMQEMRDCITKFECNICRLRFGRKVLVTKKGEKEHCCNCYNDFSDCDFTRKCDACGDIIETGGQLCMYDNCEKMYHDKCIENTN